MSNVDCTHPSGTDLSKRLVNIRQRSEKIEDRMRAACHEARLLLDEHAALSSATRTSPEADHTRQLHALGQRAQDIEDRMNSIHTEADVAAKDAAAFLLACDNVEVDDAPPVDLFPATEGVLIPELLEDESDEATQRSGRENREKGKQHVSSGTQDGGQEVGKLQAVDTSPYPWFPEYWRSVAPRSTEMELLIIDARTSRELEVIYSPWRAMTSHSSGSGSAAVSGKDPIPRIVVSPPSTSSEPEVGMSKKSQAPPDKIPALSSTLMPPSRSCPASRAPASEIPSAATRGTASSFLQQLASAASASLTSTLAQRVAADQPNLTPAGRSPDSFGEERLIPQGEDKPAISLRSSTLPNAYEASINASAPSDVSHSGPALPSGQVVTFANTRKPSQYERRDSAIPLNAYNRRIDSPLPPPTQSSIAILQKLKDTLSEPCRKYHLLGSCPQGRSCPFSHDDLDNEVLRAVRTELRKKPCQYLKHCRKVDCIRGHHCSALGCEGPGSGASTGNGANIGDGADVGDGCRFDAEAHLLDLEVVRYVSGTVRGQKQRRDQQPHQQQPVTPFVSTEQQVSGQLPAEKKLDRNAKRKLRKLKKLAREAETQQQARMPQALVPGVAEALPGRSSDDVAPSTAAVGDASSQIQYEIGSAGGNRSGMEPTAVHDQEELADNGSTEVRGEDPAQTIDLMSLAISELEQLFGDEPPELGRALL